MRLPALHIHVALFTVLASSGCADDGEAPLDATDTQPGPDGESTGTEPLQPGEPRYPDAIVYSLDGLPGLADPTDIYVPVSEDEAFPVALLLQGANVDKQYYSQFATTVARYGFVVVVPNHTSASFAGEGLFMEQSVVVDALAGVTMLAGDPSSEIAGVVDETRAGLLGHSYGGVVGVNALSGQCTVPFCSGSFELPASVVAGVFYGTDMRSPLGGDIPEVANVAAMGLIRGTADTASTPEDAAETYVQIQAGPAALATVEGANHYGLTDVDNPPGAEPESAVSSLDQADAVDRVGRLAGLLLRAWVANDGEALQFAQSGGVPGVTVETK